MKKLYIILTLLSLNICKINAATFETISGRSTDEVIQSGHKMIIDFANDDYWKYNSTTTLTTPSVKSSEIENVLKESVPTWMGPDTCLYTVSTLYQGSFAQTYYRTLTNQYMYTDLFARPYIREEFKNGMMSEAQICGESWAYLQPTDVPPLLPKKSVGSFVKYGPNMIYTATAHSNPAIWIENPASTYVVLEVHAVDKDGTSYPNSYININGHSPDSSGILYLLVYQSNWTTPQQPFVYKKQDGSFGTTYHGKLVLSISVLNSGFFTYTLQFHN